MQSILFCRNDGSSQKVSLVATGALTNIALLLNVYPEIKEMIEVGLANRWVKSGRHVLLKGICNR